MTSTMALTDSQFALLTRVVADDPPAKGTEGHLASSIYALRARKLVTTRTPFSYWTAEPTTLGRAHLERPTAGGAPRRRKASTAPKVRSRTAPITPPQTSPPIAICDSMPASALIAHLLQSPEPLVIEQPDWQGRRKWNQLLDRAIVNSAMPPDLTLRFTGRSVGDLRIWLGRADPALTTVTVPAKVMRPHPFVAALRDAPACKDGWIWTRRTDGCVHVNIAKASRSRAVRLLHALVAAATQRGYDIQASSSKSECAGGLAIYIVGHGIEVTLVEETDQIPHVATQAELTRAVKESWYTAPERDPVPSGRLRLEVGHGGYNTVLARDRKRATLEEQLGLALRKLEDLAADAAERDREYKRQEQLREEARRLALERAKDRYVSAKNEEALLGLVARHTTAQQVRDFVERAERALLDEDVAEWLVWAKQYAETIDPVSAGFTVPQIPEPTPSDLEKYVR